MRPKLSVIIPVYKVEKYIRQCLDSVYSQTFRDFEVIIIDDGSPDNCGKICDEYAEKYGDEIKTKVIHKKNGGLCRARNGGIDATQGEWITFVDSDDWLESDYYESIFKSLGDQNVDVFVAGVCFVEAYNGSQTKQYFFAEDKLYKTPKELDHMMVRALLGEKDKTHKISLGVTGAPWDKIYRSDFVRNNGLHFETKLKVKEDVLFNFIAFGKAHGVGVSTVCGYHYRYVECSITHQINFNTLKSMVVFLETANDYLKNNNKSMEVKHALNSYAIGCIVTSLAYFSADSQKQKSMKERTEEFRKYVSQPCFSDAIWEGRNPYLTIKKEIIKLMLRKPGSFLIRSYGLYQELKQKCGKI